MSPRKMSKEITARINCAKLDLLTRIQTTDPDSPTYLQLVTQYEKLNAIDTTPQRRRVSPDTLALILANFAGILVIVGYEQLGNVFTSKAQNHLIKPT